MNPRRRRGTFGFLACVWLGGACDSKAPTQREPFESSPPASESTPTEPRPRELYLPTDENRAAPSDSQSQLDVPEVSRPCPPEMVLVMGSYCVDRYEVVLEDERSGFSLSPHYPPTPLAASLHAEWVQKAPRSAGRLGLLPVPEAASIDLLRVAVPRALSKPGVVPQGYLSKLEADRACKNAGKRLCTLNEWVTACEGQGQTQFPYGSSFETGACNVHRTNHPAALLHRDASRNHLDPRLGLTYDEEGPLLRRTGATPACKSAWGGDGLFDMVGNVDEWVDTEGAAFLGGFFSRATREGCLSRITSHRADYLDYSLGTRCCLDRLPRGSGVP
jgi:formylglycine-generating enzyme